MASQSVSIGTSPIDIVAALSLETGQPYLLEVVRGSLASARIWEGGSTAPTDRSAYHAVGPGARIGIKPSAADPIWVWTPRGSAHCVVTAQS